MPNEQACSMQFRVMQNELKNGGQDIFDRMCALLHEVQDIMMFMHVVPDLASSDKESDQTALFDDVYTKVENVVAACHLLCVLHAGGSAISSTTLPCRLDSIGITSTPSRDKLLPLEGVSMCVSATKALHSYTLNFEIDCNSRNLIVTKTDEPELFNATMQRMTDTHTLLASMHYRKKCPLPTWNDMHTHIQFMRFFCCLYITLCNMVASGLPIAFKPKYQIGNILYCPSSKSPKLNQL